MSITTTTSTRPFQNTDQGHYDRIADSLQQATQAVQAAQASALNAAGAAAVGVVDETAAAVAHQAAAIVDVVATAGYSVAGAADLVQAGGRASIGAAGVLAAGVVGFGEGAIDLAEAGVHHSARGGANFLVKAFNKLNNLTGQEDAVIRVTGYGKDEVEYAGKIYDAAMRQFGKAGEELDQAGENFQAAAAHAVNAIINQSFTVGHLAGAMAYSVAGLVAVGVAGAEEVAEWGLRAARAAVILADKAQAEANMAILATASLLAKISNATADSNNTTVEITPEFRNLIERLEAQAQAA